MAQPITLCEHDSVVELRRKIKTSDDEAQKARIRAIINIKEGATRVEVAKRFVVDTDSITAWVKAYNKGGVAALKMSKGGRPEGNPRWDRKVFDALTKEIDKGGRYWSVPLMQQWIKENFKKDIPENTVWYHVTGLDYSYKSARSHPYQGDALKQEAFKRGVSRPSSTH